MDTIIICSLTGLTLLCSGIDLNYGVTGEISLVSEALGTLFTQKGGALVIAVALALFAFSTILGWALYGSRCCEFIFGSKAIRPYQVIYVLMIVVGATVDLELVWNIADTLNGLMALPNLIALALLSGVVVKCTKEYFAKENLWKNRNKLETRIPWNRKVFHGILSGEEKIVQRRKGKMRKPFTIYRLRKPAWL